MTGDSRLRESIRTLYPGYFALVMATGIISNGFYLLDFKVLSAVMIVIAVGAFLVLAAATIARALLFPANSRQTWSTPGSSFPSSPWSPE